jgi:hypothetical protein
MTTLLEPSIPAEVSLFTVVQLGEPAPVPGRAVVLELGHRLVGQVVAVDEEQHPLEPAEVSSRYAVGHGRVRLARPVAICTSDRS